jgi:AraC-like DNA-binding protein
MDRAPEVCFQKPTARISLRGARAAYVGPGLNLSPHRNAAATLAIALEAPFSLALSGGDKGLGPATLHWTALIPSGARHHLCVSGAMAFFYLDPLSNDLKTLSTQKLAQLDAAGRAMLLAPMKVDAVETIGRLFHLWPKAIPPADPRISALTYALDQHPEDFPNLQHAATHAGLSASRCQALLKEHLGMPFRRYRLWRRMACAMRDIANGANFTQAAHAVGFNSSAHFSTAFRAMFGLAPSTLLSLGVEFDLD